MWGQMNICVYIYIYVCVCACVVQSVCLPTAIVSASDQLPLLTTMAFSVFKVSPKLRLHMTMSRQFNMPQCELRRSDKGERKIFLNQGTFKQMCGLGPKIQTIMHSIEHNTEVEIPVDTRKRLTIQCSAKGERKVVINTLIDGEKQGALAMALSVAEWQVLLSHGKKVDTCFTQMKEAARKQVQHKYRWMTLEEDGSISYGESWWLRESDAEMNAELREREGAMIQSMPLDALDIGQVMDGVVAFVWEEAMKSCRFDICTGCIVNSSPTPPEDDADHYGINGCLREWEDVKEVLLDHLIAACDKTPSREHTVELLAMVCSELLLMRCEEPDFDWPTTTDVRRAVLADRSEITCMVKDLCQILEEELKASKGAEEAGDVTE